jgi:ABC-type branched-subunit amino acid transport system substrate-binding protein
MKNINRAWPRSVLVAALVCSTMAVTSITAGASSTSPRRSVSASKSPLNIMTITFTPANGSDWTLGLQAEIDYFKAHGGIDGHQINWTFCSDGTEVDELANLAAACAEQAVQSHDIAVVGSQNLYDDLTVPILAAADIPYISEYPEANIDYTSSDSFLLVHTVSGSVAGLSGVLALYGHVKKVGLVLEAGESNDTLAVAAFSAMAKYSGAKVAPPQYISATETDVAPAIATLESEGVTGIGDDLSGGISPTAFVEAIKDSQNPNVKVSVSSTSMTPAVLSALGPLANGVLAEQSAVEMGFTNFESPGPLSPNETLMFKEWNTYEPAAKNTNALDEPAWAGGYAFQQGVLQVIKDNLPLTAKNLKKTLNTMTISTGLFPPVDFAVEGPIPGQPRVHNLSSNYQIIQNDTLQILSRKNFSAGPALEKYPHG